MWSCFLNVRDCSSPRDAYPWPDAHVLMEFGEAQTFTSRNMGLSGFCLRGIRMNMREKQSIWPWPALYRHFLADGSVFRNTD